MIRFISVFLFLTFSASSVWSQESMGLLIKNRKTKEMLGVKCTAQDENKICISFQFMAVAEGAGQNELQVLGMVGSPKNYKEFSKSIQSISNSIYNYGRKESFIVRDGIYLEQGELDDFYISDHAMGFSAMLIVAPSYKDWSVGGKIWRATVGVITLPFTAAVDGVRYLAEGLVIAGEMTGKTLAYGAIGATYDIPDHLAAKRNSKKVKSALTKSALNKYRGKVTKVSDKVFVQIKNGINDTYYSGRY
ncbi:MAG: hypothetical protein JNM93_07715 [Bacteriovoracaceae bacterium]|nr:hypothetical protein [Bacteriovoracaceae bacterium]